MNDTATQQAMGYEEIRAAAEQLSPADRMALAKALLDTLSPGDANIDELWREEIESRMAAVRSGELELVDAATVFAALKKK